MKTNQLLLLIGLSPLNVLGQFWISPADDAIIEWSYDCHDSYSRDICFGVAAYDLGGLILNHQYQMLMGIPGEYDNFRVILEPSDHYYWTGEDTRYWTWVKEGIYTETLGLIFCGRNEDLIAGSYVPIDLEVTPAYGYPRSARVYVNITEPYYISGPKLACTSPVSFTLEEVPTSYTSVTWKILQGSSVISSGTGDEASASISSNGNYQVGYVMKFSCGLDSLIYTKDFHFGPYSSSDYPISGPSSAPCQSYVYYSMPQLEGETSVEWTWLQDWTYISGQGTRYLSLRTGNYSGTVAGRVNNTCGLGGSYATKYTSVYGYCGFMALVTPNPATDFINITINEPDISAFDSLSNFISQSDIDVVNEYKIMISDNFGRVYNDFVTKEKSFNFSIQHLKKGNYIITATKGKILCSTHIVVND